MARVIVMLSTYNGEKYIEEQLNSLLTQDYPDFCVLIRDDGSKDNTVSILEKFCTKDNRIQYYIGPNIGARNSFFDIMKNVDEADYYAFCDQDDVWEKDKIRIAVEKLDKQDASIPQMYCSNLSVVNEKLEFERLCHKVNFTLDNKFLAFTEYPAVGCTVVFNKTAMETIIPTIPNNVTMHDAWVYMYCQFFGNVVYDNTPHILYRQHECNVIGARQTKISIWKDRIKRLFDHSIQPRLNNANVFNRCFGDTMSCQDKATLNLLLTYKDGLKGRIRFLLNRKLVASNIERTVRLKLLAIWGLL